MTKACLNSEIGESVFISAEVVGISRKSCLVSDYFSLL